MIGSPMPEGRPLPSCGSHRIALKHRRPRAAIRAVSAQLQPGGRLFADANNGWRMHDAVRVVKAVRDFDIEQRCCTRLLLLPGNSRMAFGARPHLNSRRRLVAEWSGCASERPERLGQWPSRRWLAARTTACREAAMTRHGRRAGVRIEKFQISNLRFEI